MQNPTQASHTAITASAARAAHLIVDRQPHIFADTLAERLLGEQADELIAYHRVHGDHLVLSGARAQATVRARFTEDRVAAAIDARTRQYVIVGAGLDTFAYRSPDAARIRVFEVDHPATQRWKRDRLAAEGIGTVGTVTYVAADLESDPLVAALVDAGFDRTRPAIVSWLGVTMYLTGTAIDQTLMAIGTLAPGSEVVVDYMLPDGERDDVGDTYVQLVSPVAAERGEPWLAYLSPGEWAIGSRRPDSPAYATQTKHTPSTPHCGGGTTRYARLDYRCSSTRRSRTPDTVVGAFSCAPHC